MAYAHSEKGVYPSVLNPKTLKTVVANKSLFRVDNNSVVRKVEDNLWVLYIPVTQRIETILRYHHNMGHTRSRNLLLFLRSKMWWPHMSKDILETLDQCEVCEKFKKLKSPAKSVIQGQIESSMNNGLLMSLDPCLAVRKNTSSL